MKRVSALILMLLFFIVNTGFAINMHYCMDKFDSVQLGSSDSDVCNKCGMHTEESNGCCRDEVKVVKLQQDVSQAQFTVVNFSISPAVITALSFLDFTPKSSVETEFENIHAPPLISEQDTYIKNCVFRI